MDTVRSDQEENVQPDPSGRDAIISMSDAHADVDLDFQSSRDAIISVSAAHVGYVAPNTAKPGSQVQVVKATKPVWPPKRNALLSRAGDRS